MNNSLTAISPLDGRYADKVNELSPFFSEFALIKYRVQVEIEYFIALSLEKKIKEVPAFSADLQKKLRAFYLNLTLADAEKIKLIENTTKHDMKAVEYFIKEKISKLSCAKYSEFIHFALTSEDANNLSYTLMLKDGLEKIIYPEIDKIVKILQTFAKQNKNVPLLALTHGQPATPTTLGKEMAVYVARIKYSLDTLKATKLLGKLNGATGNFAAVTVAYPEIDWMNFSQKFIKSLGLNPNFLTTQIESHNAQSFIFDGLARVNNVIKNLDQDMWLYISRGIFILQKKEGEVGSSTMPHKVNPINFENSEGNLGLANSILHFMSDKLTISRLQRDLSDSTVIRNQGVGLAYSLLAYKNTLIGLEKVKPNLQKINDELEDHWEVLAEPIQVVLRKVGYAKPYEKLKELTQGQKITKETIQTFVRSLDIPKIEKEKLLKLTPQNYTGLSSKLSLI